MTDPSPPPDQSHLGHSPADHSPADHSHADHSPNNHAHGRIAAPASVRVRRVLAALVVPLVLSTAIAMVVLWPRSDGPQSTNDATVSLKAATVTQVLAASCQFAETADPS